MAYETELKKVEETKLVVTKITCDDCHESLPFADGYASKSLTIRLCGGYGQFFDDRDVVIILCSNCAEKLLDNNAIFGSQMQKQSTW